MPRSQAVAQRGPASKFHCTGELKVLHASQSPRCPVAPELTVNPLTRVEACTEVQISYYSITLRFSGNARPLHSASRSTSSRPAEGTLIVRDRSHRYRLGVWVLVTRSEASRVLTFILRGRVRSSAYSAAFQCQGETLRMPIPKGTKSAIWALTD